MFLFSLFVVSLSSVLFHPKQPPTSLPPSTQLATDRLDLSRDYLITQFHHKRILDRDTLNSILRLDLQTMTTLLEEISYQDTEQRGQWEFKLPTDPHFMQQFPDVINSQRRQLLELEKKLQTVLEAEYHGFNTSGLPSRTLHSSSSSIPSLTPQSAHDQGTQFLQGLFSKYGVIAKSFIEKELKRAQQEKGKQRSRIETRLCLLRFYDCLL